MTTDRRIALTAWPEKPVTQNPMPTNTFLTSPIPPADAAAQPDAGVLALLAGMRELQASLEGSRKAILTLDLAAIERGTSEQTGLIILIRELDALRRYAAEPRAPILPATSPEQKSELRRSGARILEAARLQVALLARAQGKLRVLANMLAGPSVDYGRLFGAGVLRVERPGSRMTFENDL
jgi:hypothetical protein